MKISICLGLIVVAFVFCPSVKASGSHSNYPIKYSSCAKARCNRNAVCIEENNKAWCDCLLGYEAHPQRPNKCVRHKRCQPTTCGRNAKCINRFNGPSCFCPAGYTGNPSAICDKIGGWGWGR